MQRFAIFLVICALFLGQGFSAGAAMCVHRSADAHARALGSGDRVAQSEDDAASLMAKKVAASGSNGLTWVAHLTAPTMIVPPRALADRVARVFDDGPALLGIAAVPLLRPPHAIG